MGWRRELADRVVMALPAPLPGARAGAPSLLHSLLRSMPLAAMLLLTPGLALAQSAEGLSVDPSKKGPSKATEHTTEPGGDVPPQAVTVSGFKPSPAFTQDRAFSGTRFWLLDPGEYETEVWFSQKRKKDDTKATLLQVEMEFGLAPHLQLDVYQNFSTDGELRVEGQQIELRYSFGLHYNDIPLNPVLYLEWHPRKDEQDRAEVRLLLGGDVGKWLWAANLFYEVNVDRYGAPGAEGADMELGLTAAASYGFNDYFRLGAEVKTGGDMHGLNEDGSASFKPMMLVGPNVLFKVPSLKLKLTATCFFGLFDQDPRVYPLVIAGWGF